MAIFQIEAPDGTQFELEGDQPPTGEQLKKIFSQIQSQRQAAAPAAQAAPQAAPQQTEPPQGAGPGGAIRETAGQVGRAISGGVEKFVESPLVSQFLQGQETAERGLQAILSTPLEEQLPRRTKLTTPKNIFESSAKLAGEYLAPTGPIPFGGTVSKGLAGATQAAGQVAGALSRSSKALNAFRKTIDNVTSRGGQIAKNRLADTLRFFGGISEVSTKRLLDKGSKILKPEYLVKDELSKANRKKAIEGVSTAFRKVGKEFDKAVKPFLRDDDTLNIDSAIAGFYKALNDSEIVKIIPIKAKEVKPKTVTEKVFDPARLSFKEVKKTVKPPKQKPPGITDIVIEEGIADPEGAFPNAIKKMNEAIAEFRKNPTSERLHNLRRKIDKIKYNSKLQNEFETSAIISKFRNKLQNVLPPEYKKVNSRFSKLFKLRDELGLKGKLGRSNVENTMLKLQKGGRSELREGLAELDTFLPKKNKFFEDVLDEVSAKEFTDFEPRLFRGAAGATVVNAATNLGPIASLVVGGGLTSPRLLGKSALGLQAAARGLGKGVSAPLQAGAKVAPRALGRGVIREQGLGEEDRRSQVLQGLL